MVRSKHDWFLKVVMKWAKEAILLGDEVSVEKCGDTMHAIRLVNGHPLRLQSMILIAVVASGLQSEARRICVLDHTIHIQSAHLSERTIDMDTIVNDVEKVVDYTICYIRAPPLTKDVTEARN